MTQLPQPIEAWAARHRPVLAAFGTVLSFAVLFAGTALAASHSGVADGGAVLCGLGALLTSLGLAPRDAVTRPPPGSTSSGCCSSPASRPR